MSNITNSVTDTQKGAVISNIYAQIVEIKKKQLELTFTPVSNRGKDHTTQVRNLRSHLANLQRDIAAARQGKEVAVREVSDKNQKSAAKKRGKK